MTRLRASLLTLAGLAVLGATAARADDAAAQELLREAYGHWKDESPAAAVELAEKALAANPTTPLVRAQVALFLGSLHQVKTGDLEQALAQYDAVDALLRDATAEDARRLRVQALVRKANIVYAERNDHEAALELYRQAQEAHHLASTAETASQLCYRVARGATSDDERARYLDLALLLAREAVDWVPPRREGGGEGGQARGGRMGAWRAKFRLQLVIVLEAQGKKDEAAAVWAEVDPEAFDENAQYQLALLHALRGDLAKAGEALTKSMAARPTADTRNQLRKYLRTEPDFAPALQREDWSALVTDEPVPPRSGE